MTTVPKRSRLPFDPINEAMRQWRSHGWDDAANGVGVVTSVIRAEQILSGRAEEAVRPLGLTFARYEVLMLLQFSRRGELPLGKIGERLQVGAASVTNAIDRLELDRMVRRRMNPDDGRGVLAAITNKGIALSGAGDRRAQRVALHQTRAHRGRVPRSLRPSRDAAAEGRRLRRVGRPDRSAP